MGEFRGRDIRVPEHEWQLIIDFTGKHEVRHTRPARLQQVLNEAQRSVPYYRERIAAPQCGALESLARVPVLTKALVREHFDSLISTAEPTRAVAAPESSAEG